MAGPRSGCGRPDLQPPLTGSNRPSPSTPQPEEELPAPRLTGYGAPANPSITRLFHPRPSLPPARDRRRPRIGGQRSNRRAGSHSTPESRFPLAPTRNLSPSILSGRISPRLHPRRSGTGYREPSRKSLTTAIATSARRGNSRRQARTQAPRRARRRWGADNGDREFPDEAGTHSWKLSFQKAPDSRLQASGPPGGEGTGASLLAALRVSRLSARPWQAQKRQLPLSSSAKRGVPKGRARFGRDIRPLNSFRYPPRHPLYVPGTALSVAISNILELDLRAPGTPLSARFVETQGVPAGSAGNGRQPALVPGGRLPGVPDSPLRR